MNCDDFQRLVSESLDAGDTARLNPEVEQHPASCPSCREFRSSWAALDAQLTRRTVSAVLPADFKATLFARLPSRRPQLSPKETMNRRAKLEREHREAMDALHRTYLLPQTLKMLRLLVLAAGCVVAGVVVSELISRGPLAVEAASRQLAVAATVQLLGCVVGLAAVLHGIRRTWGPAIRGLPLWYVLRARSLR